MTKVEWRTARNAIVAHEDYKRNAVDRGFKSEVAPEKWSS